MTRARSTNKALTTDILIAGAGIPGLTLALLLAQKNADLAITLIDPAPPSPTANPNDSRTSALMQGSLSILTQAGLDDSVFSHGGLMTTLTIIDDSHPGRDRKSVTFHADEINQNSFGINMPNGTLRAALAKKIKHHKNIRMMAPARLSSFIADDAGITARLEDDRILRTPLIIGADGRGSAVRAATGIVTEQRAYGQSAITCLITHTRPHYHTSSEFHRPSGPFTLVPLPGNISSVVWVEYEQDAGKFLRLDKRSFIQALQDRSRGLLGTVDLMTPPQSWPLEFLKARRLTARRVALIAEAAHVLHPLGAQGLNLSLRDAADLARILLDAFNLGLDPGSTGVLASYESARARDIALRARGTDALNKLVSTTSPLARRLRLTGLGALDHFSLLKDIAMREGMAA